MTKIRAAVIGVGAFGHHHLRVLRSLKEVQLAAIVDIEPEKAQQAGAQYEVPAFTSIEPILGRVEAAIVAAPTVTHAAIASQLLEAGIDVLVEKPIAACAADGDRLARLAQEHGRILQAGHLERFNPAVTALEQILTLPLFFEVHRLSMFTPRSLDIDVVLDLMIHDLDIVLSLTGNAPVEIRAAGISVLSPQVDIANARLSFANGCVANLTASRVSTEKIRKLRVFQPGEYISLDYQRQEVLRLAVSKPQPDSSPSGPFVRQDRLEVRHGEPLELELAAFFGCIRSRERPRVDGFEAANMLRVAEAVLVKIKEHAELVAATLQGQS